MVIYVNKRLEQMELSMILITTQKMLRGIKYNMKHNIIKAVVHKNK
jgi:hypothetical protein